MAGGFREIIKGWFGRKELGRQNSRTRERGNVFFTLFGAVAVVGVLGAGIMSTMRGPLTTMVEVNRIEETKAEMAVGLRLLLLNATNQDDDVLTEPNQPASCSGMPTGAGCVPTGGPAKQKDAWGSYYAYCAWNNGSDNDAIGSLIHKGGASTNNIAVALISAGPDRKFDTSCADASTFITPSDGGGDDIVRKYNYNDAVAGSDGLWALQAGASGDEARVEEEISVGGGAGSVSTFEGSGAFGENVRTEGEIQTDVISPHPTNALDYIEFTGSVLLPEVTGLSCGANEGAIAFDASEDIVAFCDGSSWQPLGKKFWIADANGIRNNDTLAPHVGIGTGSSSAYSLYVNGGTATDTLKATGIVDFDSTLNVDGAATLKDSLEVTSDTKLNARLDVVGATELDATLGVDGTSEFRGDVTVISDVFVNKTATGGGNITAEDAITATEGDITATAGNVVATAGNVEATAGDVTAGQDVIAERHVKATTGDVEAVAGDVVATAGNVEAVEGNIIALGTSGKVVGKSFHRGSDGALDFSNIEACDPETEKTVWSTVSGWGCEPDNGTGTGDDGEMTLQDVLGRGNDAEGQDAEDFGKIGADEYCDAGLSTCVSSADLISGSSIWIRNTGDPSKIYYNGGHVGIGTNDPQTPLDIYSSATGYSLSLSVADESTSPSIVFYSKRGDPLETLGSNNPSGGNKGWRVGPIGNASTATELQNDFYIASWDGVAWGSRITFEMGGNVGIGVGSATAAATKLDINGTLKIGDGTELCNVTDHEGALKYDAAGDNFYMCRNSSVGWELLGAGGGGGSGGGSAKGLTVAGSTTTLTNGVMTDIVFSAAPSRNDFGAGAWTGNKSFTVPVGEEGWYAITGHYSTPNTFKHGMAYVTVNDGTISVSRDVSDAASSIQQYVDTSAIAYLTAGDVVELAGNHASGSNIAITSARMSLVKIGVGSGNGSGSGGGITLLPSPVVIAGTSLGQAGVTDQVIDLNTLSGVTVPSGATAAIVTGYCANFVTANESISMTVGENGAVACGQNSASSYNDTDYSTTFATLNGTSLTYSITKTNANSGGGSLTLLGFVAPGGGSGSGGQDVSFSAKSNSAQSIPLATSTKANFAVENFDSNNNFDLATGRFTPTVPGKYILNAYAQYSSLDANAWATVQIFKNGANVQGGNYQRIGSTSGIGSTASTIVEANGTTDYFEVYVYHGGSSGAEDVNLVQFSGALVGGGGSGGSDTLAGLSCTDGQVVGWDDGAGEWACADMGAGGSGGGFAAHVLFDGEGCSGSCALRNASNVSSVTRNAAGDYSIAFTTPMADTDYLIIATGGRSSASYNAGGEITVKPGSKTTNGFGIHSWRNRSTESEQLNDVPDISVVVIDGSGGGSASGTDTLAGLNCTSGQVAAWDGTAWACSSSAGGGGQDVSFSVKQASAQSIPNATATKVVFGTENFDSNNNFDTTASRFTPTVAGKYILNASVQMGDALGAAKYSGISLYKNGALAHRQYTYNPDGANSMYANPTVSAVVDANGTTDYFEVFFEHNHGSARNTSASINTFFTGALVGGSAGSGSDIWTDSGNGYIEYSVADSGVKLQNITGMAQPALGLASGMTWDGAGDTLIIDGNITYTGTITDTSDRRMKTDIDSLIKNGSMLEKIKAIDTYSFRMKDNPGAAKEFGVMAQELETILPELVHTADDEIGTKSVNYIGLIAPMIEAVKELSREVETLHGQNLALEAENEALRAASDARFADLETEVALLNKIVVARDTQKASSLALWLVIALFAGMGGTLIVIAHPKFKGRWERE